MTESEDFIMKDAEASSGEDRKSEKQKHKAESGAGPGDEQAAKDAFDATDRSKETRLPLLNFATFIFSLNSSALVNLGMIEDPGSGKKVKNLPLAKQTIDILGMLEEKTHGNLSADEEKMLKNILYDLRILYVKEKG